MLKSAVRRTSTLAAVLLFATRLSGQQAQPPVQHAGEYSQTDIQAGSIVYSAQCAQCHGPNGDQVAGVDLRTNRFRNVRSDDDLRRVVTTGIQGTSMPGRRLEPAQLTAIVAFIRNMRDFNSTVIALGDLARGRALFEGTAGCITCHRVGARGSRIAPDLSEIGSSRNPSSLQQSLIDPTSAMMPINRPVRIVTKDGRTITGRRVNEDTYSLQIVTSEERLLSIAKTDVREYQIQTTSTMPSFKDKLSTQDISDVVAYLSSLKAADARGADGFGRQGGPPAGGGQGRGRGAPPGR